MSTKSTNMMDIKKNVILAPYTTFKIGGPAKFFVEVENEEELLEVLEHAKTNSLKFFILGGGSNLLVSDDGFDGIIIKIKNQKSKIKIANQNSKVLINCWAGESLYNVVNFCTENGLSGLEWAAGIPGTIGGAVRGNAGAYGKAMADNIESIKVIKISNSPNYSNSPNEILNSKYQIPNKLQITNYKLHECEFGYRDSTFKQNNNLIILSVILELEKGDKKEIQSKIQEILEKRRNNQPQEVSAGSFFKNPIVKNEKLRKEFEEEKKIKCKDDKLPAAWLIEKADLRGKEVGGAKLSEKHSNFIVNTGGATAQDVVILASIIKQQVRDKFGVELQEEIQYLGF